MIEYAAIAEFSQLFSPFFRCHFAFFNALDDGVHELGRDHVVAAHRRDRQSGIIRQFVFSAPDAQRIERLFAALSAAAFMLFIYDKHLIWFAGGLGMLSIFVVRQIWVLKKYSQGIDAGRVKG
ncbi:MAG: hypothetical protein P8X90_26430 [Desulfobacterales bacterium]